MHASPCTDVAAQLVPHLPQFAESVIGLVHAVPHGSWPLGRLTDWTYRSMCIDLAKDGYRSGEKNGMKQHETSSLLADMLNSDDGVSVRELARELHVLTSDITPLVFHLPLQRGPLRLVHSSGSTTR